MEYRPFFWFLSCVSFPFDICQSLIGNSICMQPNSPIIKCCIGYFLEENQCLECSPGFTGDNCLLTCGPGYFGRQCNERCHCSPEKYCDPITGYMCNTTSVNCTDSEPIVTEKMVNEGTVVITQSSHYVVLPLLRSMIACLFIGSFCIRMWYAIIEKKRQELHPTHDATNLPTRTQRPQKEENDLSVVASSEVYNHLNLQVNYQNISHYYMDSMTTCGDPPACHGFSSTDHSQQKEIRISWNQLRNNDNRDHDGLDKCSKKAGFEDIVHDHTINEQLDIYSTPNKGVTRKLPNGFSKHKQQKNCCKSVKFNISETCQATAVRQTDSQTNQTEESPISTNDEDLYANNGNLAYDNNCFRPDNPMDKEDSDDYFDVSYDGQLAMSSSKNNNPGHTTSCSSETDPDLSDYINADGLGSYR